MSTWRFMSTQGQGTCNSMTFFQGRSDFINFKHFCQTPRGRSMSNFMWNLHGKGKLKFVQIVKVTWPSRSPCPYMYRVKTFRNLLSSLKPFGRCPCNLVYNIRLSCTTRFIQMIILGWPWTLFRKGQLWFLMRLHGERLKWCITQKLLKPMT